MKGNESLQLLIDAVVAVPLLTERIASLERKVAHLLPQKTQTWLTLKETAEKLRCSEKTVSRLLKAGKLRRNLDNWRVRILAEDVDAYVGRVTLPLR